MPVSGTLGGVEKLQENRGPVVRKETGGTKKIGVVKIQGGNHGFPRVKGERGSPHYQSQRKEKMRPSQVRDSELQASNERAS